MERIIEFVVTDDQLETIVDIYNETNGNENVSVDTIQDYQICKAIATLIQEQE